MYSLVKLLGKRSRPNTWIGSWFYRIGAQHIMNAFSIARFSQKRNSENVEAILEGLLLLNPGRCRAFFELAMKSQNVLLEKACLNLIKNLASVTKADLAEIL